MPLNGLSPTHPWARTWIQSAKGVRVIELFWRNRPNLHRIRAMTGSKVSRIHGPWHPITPVGWKPQCVYSTVSCSISPVRSNDPRYRFPGVACFGRGAVVWKSPSAAVQLEPQWESRTIPTRDVQFVSFETGVTIIHLFRRTSCKLFLNSKNGADINRYRTYQKKWPVHGCFV